MISNSAFYRRFIIRFLIGVALVVNISCLPLDKNESELLITVVDEKVMEKSLLTKNLTVQSNNEENELPEASEDSESDEETDLTEEDELLGQSIDQQEPNEELSQNTETTLAKNPAELKDINKSPESEGSNDSAESEATEKVTESSVISETNCTCAFSYDSPETDTDANSNEVNISDKILSGRSLSKRETETSTTPCGCSFFSKPNRKSEDWKLATIPEQVEEENRPKRYIGDSVKEPCDCSKSSESSELVEHVEYSENSYLAKIPVFLRGKRNSEKCHCEE